MILYFKQLYIYGVNITYCKNKCMCDFENGFILCSCKDKNEEVSSKNKSSGYIWELRILEKREFAVGKARYPSSNIGSGLESEWVLLNLEERNCFDFEYIPTEGDNLVMYPESNICYNQQSDSYLSFIYKSGKWAKGFYDEIEQMTTPKKKGILKKDE